MHYACDVQSDTLEDLDQKMEKMVDNGQMDPALMLVLARAHNNVKDTDYTSEEVKDVMAHMYYKVQHKALNCSCKAAMLQVSAQLSYARN